MTGDDLLADGLHFRQVLFLALQFIQMPVQAVIQMNTSLENAFDLLNRHTELSKKLNLHQSVDICLPVFPVSILRPIRCQKPLFFIEADIFLRNAHQLFHIFDLHINVTIPFPFSLLQPFYTASTRWKVKLFLTFRVTPYI